MTTAEILTRFEAVKANGNGWMARCPSHDDRDPSLSFKQEDNGDTLVKCHAGCDTEDVVATVGLKLSDLFASNGRTPVVKKRKTSVPIAAPLISSMHEAITSEQRGILCEERCLTNEVIDRYQIGVSTKYGSSRTTIPIKNASGEFEDVRCWLHPRHRKTGMAKILHWETGYGGARLFPIDMLQHNELVMVAGELDALAMISVGFPAITVTAGESTWDKDLSKQIATAGVEEVVIIPDNDEAGHKGAQKRAESLSDAGLTVRMAAWPEGRDSGWDATDELREGSKDALRRMIDDAVETRSDDPSPLYTVGTSEGQFTLRSAKSLIEESPDVEWQVDGILAEGASMLLAGEAGLGKTFLMLDLALAIDRGRPWLGHFAVKSGKVLIVDEENADRLIRRRLRKLLLAEGEPDNGSTVGIQFMTQQGLNLSDPKHVEHLKTALGEYRPSLVIVDSLVRVHQANENDAGEMAAIFRTVRDLINEFGCSFAFCHHRRKPGPMGNDSANMFRGSSEIRAFVDTHMDLRKSKSEEGRCLAEHSKSRYDEPVPSFEVEIVDLDVNSTKVRYTGEAKSQTQAIVEEGCDFLRELIKNGEWYSRTAILKAGKAAGLKRDTLDTARKILADSGEATSEKRGREVGILRSDAPNTCNGAERNVEEIVI